MAGEKHILLTIPAVRSDSSPTGRCRVYFKNKISGGIDRSVVFYILVNVILGTMPSGHAKTSP
jgi:hypothetical protein